MHVLYTHASHPPMSARTHTLLHLMHLCTHTPMHLCTEYGLCSCCHRCASTYVLACGFWRLRARPCCCSLVHRHACVCQCVCLGLYPGMRVTRAHTADVLADFCDGDVAPRSRKRSRRLPHAHLRVRIRMRVCARSCVRESLCLHSHMYAHA